MRVVLDTNTLVSAIGWGGSPQQILLALRKGKHQLILSPALLDELVRVLGYRRLRPLAAHSLLPLVLAWLYDPAHMVYPKQQIDVILEDPDDNRVLEAALAGKADAIVSGDRHLLALREFSGIPNLTPSDFVRRHL